MRNIKRKFSSKYYIIKNFKKTYEFSKIVKKCYGYDPFQVFYVSHEDIGYVTPVSDCVDYTRKKDYGTNHPHSAQDRGWFCKKRTGSIKDGGWDQLSFKFEDLIEYQSIKSFLEGKSNWEDTEFAQRVIKWINNGNQGWGYQNAKTYIKYRGNEIKNLANRIEKQGVMRISSSRYEKKLFDEITINIGRNGDFLHNNQGYHRLSIAKVCQVTEIPVLVNTRHLEYYMEYYRKLK